METKRTHNTFDRQRRRLLSGALGLGGVGTAVGVGLLAPSKALSGWLEGPIMSTDLDEALAEALGSADYEQTDRIRIDAPEVAENGETVPVTVEASLEEVDQLAILVPENTSPVSSILELGGRTRPKISQRIQMADTSDVVAIARSNGQLFGNSRQVQVTVGGCGG